MKKIVMIVVPVLVLGGGFVGLAVTGVIKVPGLTPKKPKPAATSSAAKDKPVAKAASAQKKPPAKPPELQVTASNPQKDQALGAKKLAQLWNTVPTPNLLEVAKQFEDKELAPILILMDPEKVSEIIAGLDPKRSAKLSRELQQAASFVKG